MPSIKSCLASLALVALAISPVAATPLKSECRARLLEPCSTLTLPSSTVNDAALVRRAPEPAFFSNEGAIEKRDVSRKEIAARLKRAKIAAARKAKRENRERDTSELVKRHVAALHEREGVTEEVLERRAIVERALRRTRCGVNGAFPRALPTSCIVADCCPALSTDRICTQSVTSPSDLPANGRAVCGPNHLCQGAFPSAPCTFDSEANSPLHTFYSRLPARLRLDQRRLRCEPADLRPEHLRNDPQRCLPLLGRQHLHARLRHLERLHGSRQPVHQHQHRRRQLR